MVDQNTQFYAILTNVGAAKMANASALGLALKITQMGLGDANDTDPTPNATQTALIKEWRRAPLNQLKVDDKDASIIVAEQVIPAEVGGKWIREIGLYDEDGDLIAVANCAPTYKPLLSQGSGRTQVVRMSLVVSSASNVQLKIDPSVVLATREWVTEELARQDFKHSVVVATTENITLSGLQMVDGVPLVAGNRVLVRSQAAAKDNGLYVVAAGAWSRSADADSSSKVTPGLMVHVEKGTANGDSIWQLVTNALITLGVSGLNFEMVFGLTGVGAGTYRSVTVDKNGRVTAATNPTTVAGYGLTDVYTKAEVNTALAAKAPLASPALTGTPTTTTPVAGNKSKQIANTEFVMTALAELVASAPGALDTLNELAAAIGNDPTFATTMVNALAGKAAKATTAAGYGLTDVYTKTESDSALAATGWVAGGRALAAAVNLNTITTPGSYGQASNGGATLALNYPEALAGTLLVQAAGAGLITQTYSVRGPNNKKYERNLYGGVWSAWGEVANVTFVQAVISALVDSAPGTLDTLKKLATALGNDPNFASTVASALNLKAALASPFFTGNPRVPTVDVGSNDYSAVNTFWARRLLAQYGLGHNNTGVVPATQDDLATLLSGNYYYPSTITPYGATAFVQRMTYAANRGFEIANYPYQKRIFGRVSNNDGTWHEPFELANLDSPAFTGTPSCPTAVKGANNQLLANTAFVQAAIAALVDSAPGALDTLKELAVALGNDPNFATTMTNALAGKASKATTLGGYGITDALVVKNNYVSRQLPTLASPTAGLGAGDTGLVLREAQEVGAAQASDDYGPGIGFWWAARKSGRLIMDAAGLLKWNGNPLLSGTVASQAEVEQGVSETAVVTPRRLRFGFAASWTPNGYLILPSWLGSFVFQWGTVPSSAVAGTQKSFVIPFPNKFLCMVGSPWANLSSAFEAAEFFSATESTFMSANSAAQTNSYFAIGY